MSDEEGILFLIKEDDSGRSFALLSFALVVGLAFHAYTFNITKAYDIANKYALDTYSIDFEHYDVQGSDSILIASGETDVLQLSRDIMGVEEGSLMAQIAFDISYSESSGQIGDPCDEVHVSIAPNGMVADWQNEDNVLSDSNDNCDPMTLLVYVYPEYVGESSEVVGSSANYWNDLWTNETYGSGTIELEISVETNEGPTSFATGGDDNEEITVQWTVSFFEVEITTLPL
jgi:hypothetical protein